MMSMKTKTDGLRNGPALSDAELNKWGHSHIEGFVPVIDRTKIPLQLSYMVPGDSTIINLDGNYKQGGTHWTAIRLSSEGPFIIYYDSFGAPPPEELVTYSRSKGIGLLYCDYKDQKIKQTNCGWRAATFLEKLAKAAKEKKEIEMFRKLCE